MHTYIPYTYNREERVGRIKRRSRRMYKYTYSKCIKRFPEISRDRMENFFSLRELCEYISTISLSLFRAFVLHIHFPSLALVHSYTRFSLVLSNLPLSISSSMAKRDSFLLWSLWPFSVHSVSVLVGCLVSVRSSATLPHRHRLTVMHRCQWTNVHRVISLLHTFVRSHSDFLPSSGSRDQLYTLPR